MRDLKASAIAVVVLTLVLGLGVPALFTGFAQLAFSSQANGSLIKRDGAVVGSRLAAQAFSLLERNSARQLRGRRCLGPSRTWHETHAAREAGSSSASSC